jgi:hypothetical protein
MKTSTIFLVALLTLGVFAVFHPTAHAQDFIFTSFSCVPASCIDETPVPVTQGTAIVTYSGTCSGGAIAGVSGTAKAQVGINGQCQTTYTPHAEVDKYRTTYLNDCGVPFSVDTVREIAEVKKLGAILWQSEASVSCDGGVDGPTGAGTKPC